MCGGQSSEGFLVDHHNDDHDDDDDESSDVDNVVRGYIGFRRIKTHENIICCLECDLALANQS